MQMPCATLHCGSQCLTNSTITLWMHAKPDGGASNSLAKGQQCVAEHGEAYDCATDQHQAHHWQTFRNAASQLKIKQSRLFKDERFRNLAKQILHSRLEGGGGGGRATLQVPVDTRCWQIEARRQQAKGRGIRSRVSLLLVMLLLLLHGHRRPHLLHTLHLHCKTHQNRPSHSHITWYVMHVDTVVANKTHMTS